MKIKNVILGFVGLSLSASGLFAQGVTMRLESDVASLGGEFLNRANRVETATYAYGFYVAPASLNEVAGRDIFSAFGANPTLETWAPVLSYLQSVEPRAIGPAGGPASFGIYNGVIGGVPADLVPMMLITSGNEWDSLSIGDGVGLVAASGARSSLANPVVGFNTAAPNNWNTYIIGNPGSIQLVSVIPEPSTYAALFGIFALAGVMIRRRLRK